MEEVDISIRWANHCFRVFVKHHYNCTKFVWIDYMQIVFALYNELNAFDDLWTVVLPREFLPSVIRWIIRISGCWVICSKAVLNFSTIFLNFGSDTIGKPGIMNLSSYNSKIHDSRILSDSEVPFLGKWNNATFFSFLYCVLFIDHVAWS